MTTAIKAIETKYKGYRFRSRLEARWAVFFDTMGIEWIYEPEGFDLPGYPYDKDAQFKYYMDKFARESPLSPAENEKLAKTLVEKGAEMASKSIYYLPDFWLPGPQAFAEVKAPIRHENDNRNFLVEYEKMIRLVDATGCKILYCTDFVNPIKGMKPGEFIEFHLDPKRFDIAFTAARSARFEHGETPT